MLMVSTNTPPSITSFSKKFSDSDLQDLPEKLLNYFYVVTVSLNSRYKKIVLRSGCDLHDISRNRLKITIKCLLAIPCLCQRSWTAKRALKIL